MDLPNFEKLEAQILKLIHRHEGLKNDYGELEQMVNGLQEEINQLKGINSRLRGELEDSKQNVRDTEKEERIRIKVEELLTQLEGI
jgi:chromosome segregation ATPase